MIPKSLIGQTNWVLTNNPQAFVDTSAVGAVQRFYRVGSPAPPPPPSLVWIKPEAFFMGSPADEAGRNPDEGPQIQVTLTCGFRMVLQCLPHG